MAIAAAATGVYPLLVEPAVNKLLKPGNDTLLWQIPLWFLAAAMVRGGANYAQTVLMHKGGLRIIATMQSQMFDRVVNADLSFIHADATGKLISRFTNDVNFLREAVIKVITGAGRDLLSVIVLVGVMFYQDWKLAALTFIVFPISVYPIIKIGRRLRRVSADTQSELGGMTSALDDIFKGLRQVKAFGTERVEQTRADGIFETIYKLVYKSARVRALSYPIMETLSGVAIAAVLLYGGYQILEGETEAGQLFAFLTALIMAYQPIRSLSNLNAGLQEGLAAAARIFNMLDYRPEIVDTPESTKLTVTDGRVRLDDVLFSYGGGPPALNGVSLDAKPGSTVALVGASGAGKSTVFNLILRFYDATAGRILIDGQDVRDVTMASLRRSVALVSQETGLFNTTVRENIAYGCADAKEADIIAAAKNASAHDFIQALPHGYETMIGEMGVRLSGGQRQRLSIARAMLKNAPILLLDEATSALDTESEKQVQNALDRLTQGRTTLVIAHRLSTVLHADEIFVFDEGRIAERGTHTNLLRENGLYARLCAAQLERDVGDGLETPSIIKTA